MCKESRIKKQKLISHAKKIKKAGERLQDFAVLISTFHYGESDKKDAGLTRFSTIKASKKLKQIKKSHKKLLDLFSDVYAETFDFTGKTQDQAETQDHAETQDQIPDPEDCPNGVGITSWNSRQDS